LGQDQRCVLVGHGQSQFSGESRRIGAETLAPDGHRTAIRLYESAGDPEESRLPRSVLADEGMDLAGATIEADIGQRPDRSELAGDPAQLENGDRGGQLSCGSAVAHPAGYIKASTSSGTSEVFDTVGVTRSGLQSSAVTSRMT
jgi:hypothetical protein